MTREEHLTFCKKCVNRRFDPQSGILCNLTNKIADFEGACSSFLRDESVKEVVREDEQIPYQEALVNLDEISLSKLRKYQDFPYAIVGGVMSAILSAILWAAITVATEYQIGFMAVGVGLLVGFSVRYFGAGVDPKFGFLGAILALFGCLLGNLFSQVGFIAQEESLGYFETLTYLNPALIVTILSDSFNPIDLLFYGIAVFEGYKFSFRTISPEMIAMLQSNDYKPYPSNYKLRFPLVIGSLLVLLFVAYKVSSGVNGIKVYQYDSGEISAEGEMKKSKAHGKWTYYYENGKIQSVGYYEDGIPEGDWQWFNEDGILIKEGNYKNGLENGIWINYYLDGKISDSSNYLDSRLDGAFVSKYENGNVYQKGYYMKNAPDSIWTTFYMEGQIMSVGKMKDGKSTGEWKTYHINGQVSEDLFYEDDDVLINNVWDFDGNSLVENGNGIYKMFGDNGNVLQIGTVENGKKVGLWTSFYNDGKIKEKGKFEKGSYIMLNYWDYEGTQLVFEGSGDYVTYYPDGAKMEEGVYKNGLRTGLWKAYYPNEEKISQELMYSSGKLTGKQKYYYESGNLSLEGECINDLREGEWAWYYENGSVSSTATFVNDKKDGIQYLWSELGQKVKEEFYKNGILVKENYL